MALCALVLLCANTVFAEQGVFWESGIYAGNDQLVSSDVAANEIRNTDAIITVPGTYSFGNCVGERSMITVGKLAPSLRSTRDDTDGFFGGPLAET
ncbi:MAG: hypothetical protein BM559_08470 [Roseobacter sp. MedPE-SWchi]|mgnify:CR=1 FL=1|nr:MAG: hypothetical protein BM559_08470 [Roseobacter sp. MedPE-SWchi]